MRMRTIREGDPVEGTPGAFWTRELLQGLGWIENVTIHEGGDGKVEAVFLLDIGPHTEQGEA